MRKRTLSKPLLVISIGGSIITYNDYKNVPLIMEKLDILSERYRLVVITGGGDIARKLMDVLNSSRYIGSKENAISNKENTKNVIKDCVGIAATRLHASLLAAYYGYKKYIVPTKVSDIKDYLVHYKIVFCGGIRPGQSTDAVAAECAALLKSEHLLNVSNVDGVYNKDPRKYGDARKYVHLTYREMWDLIKNYPQIPGEYRLFDHRALKIVEKNNIKVKFIDLNYLERFEEKGIGTLIS